MIDVFKKHTISLARDIPGLIRRIIIAWLLAVALEYFFLPAELQDLARLRGLAHMSFVRVIGITCGLFILLSVLSRIINTTRAERWYVVGAFGLLAAATLLTSFTVPYLTVCLLILSALVLFGIFGWNNRPEAVVEQTPAHKAHLWITALLTIGFFLFVCAWTVSRVLSLSAPSYDFGIFTQMFYRMKETGLPITTLERDGFLSHFDVHVSPIYYLMLPVFYLAPFPATLQVLQAAVLASAVIPLWKIAKNHGLSGLQRVLICGILLIYPAYSAGTGYDLHENCFLTPLLLWLFYGIDKKSTSITAVSAILTLMVKEDAAMYVAVAGLWLLVKTGLRPGKKDSWALFTGAGLLSGSLIWFFAATAYLAQSGSGVMTDRFYNFNYDGSASLAAVIKAVILNPMKLIYECVDPEKLKYILLTLLPLMGMPLLTRRYERFLLLIPYILLNLMSDYPYQHDIFYQYTFGPAAFLLYLTVINLQELKPEKLRPAILIGAVFIGVVLTGKFVVPNAKLHVKQYVSNYEECRNIHNMLSTIPKEASVAATPYYTVPLSDREVLYDVAFCSREHLLESEYVALEIGLDAAYTQYVTEENSSGFENLVALLEENGFRIYASYEDVVVIYSRILP